MSADLLVVGTGLIGTSIALALRGQLDVMVTDQDEGALSVALNRGAGRRWDGTEGARHAVVAVPVQHIAPVLQRLQRLGVADTWSHVGSSQSSVQVDIEALKVDPATLCGSHPMAGRELGGPGAATAELFAGRPWALCPSDRTTPQALAATRRIAELCGADAVQLTARDHDLAVALVSHLPQVAASALAAVVLAKADQDASALRLAGPGLQDSTRIAASDPALWTEILRSNARAVAPLVRALADRLHAAASDLDGLSGQDSPAAVSRGEQGVRTLLSSGNAGRRLIPVKHGEHDRDFAVVPVAVPDRPGQLAGVLVAAADAGVNVEDVRVEHLAGRPRGVIELLVQASEREHARQALADAGWDVVG